MILRNQPRSEWPVLQLKVTAQDALRGQRSDWGYRRKWESNYLSLVSLVNVILEFPYTHMHESFVWAYNTAFLSFPVFCIIAIFMLFKVKIYPCQM